MNESWDRSITRHHSRIQVGGVAVAPGERRRVEIPVARLPTETWLHLPLEVVNGLRPGPCLWLSAAVHGDELNGMEIIREVLEQLHPRTLHGTLIAAPIVNVFGFVEQNRYLPDRRDLNRSFPGSATGSVAAQLAHLFMSEVVQRCTHGIDLHTGSHHRTNLPQIRGALEEPETRRCALAFGAPVMMHAGTIRGTLRAAATKLGIPTLLYEAGETMRFDARAIEIGVAGVVNVMAELEMTKRRKRKRVTQPLEIFQTTWVRARRGGILRLAVDLGQHVRKKQLMGEISGALGGEKTAVLAPDNGMVIGLTNNPLVNRGDSIVHLGFTHPEKTSK